MAPPPAVAGGGSEAGSAIWAVGVPRAGHACPASFAEGVVLCGFPSRSKIIQFAWLGKDKRARSFDGWRVPLDPMPDWVPARRRQIGARIREARAAANLTQFQLGERIGRDHRTIHRWEYGQRVPNLDDLLLLADALGVPLRDLVG